MDDIAVNVELRIVAGVVVSNVMFESLDKFVIAGLFDVEILDLGVGVVVYDEIVGDGDVGNIVDGDRVVGAEVVGEGVVGDGVVPVDRLFSHHNLV